MRHLRLFLLLAGAFIIFGFSAASAETIEGRLIISVEDYPNETSATIYRLQTDAGEIYRLQVADPKSDIPPFSETGARIRVSGTLQLSTLQVENMEVLSLAASGTLVSGSRKSAIIIVNMQGGSAPCNATQLDSTFYTSPTSVRASYEASSKSQLTWTRDTNNDGNPDIFGPFSIASPVGVCNDSSPDTWAAQARAAASGAGVNLNLYQHLIYILPNWQQLGCGWSGLADLGCLSSRCEAWIADCTSINTFAHELGHNLGMSHAANANAAGDVTSEYGDWSCPMGNGEDLVQFNAPHMQQMGWFNNFPGRVTTVSTSGTYELAPLESDPTSVSLPQIIRVQLSGSEYYYLSYRRSGSTFGDLPNAYRNRVSVHRFTDALGQRTKFRQALAASSTFSDSSIGFSVQATSIGASSATVAITLPTSSDTDGDGVSDTQEGSDGTDPADPGSYFPRVSSPIYMLWNSFLGMTNIGEFSNPTTGSGQTVVNLTLYSISGEVLQTMSFALNPRDQRDVILNDMTGFVQDSYGVMKIEYTGELAGRFSFYRPSGSLYEFAYSVPFAELNRGTTAVGFNTFQPSSSAIDAGFPVYNWLSVVNISDMPQLYTIRSYNQQGTLLRESTISLDPFERRDLDGGHNFAGPSIVGLHEIIPADSTAPYIAQLVRYGLAESGSYRFAFPLAARTPNGRPQYVPTSNQFAETTWFELINASSSATTATVEFRSQAGNLTSQSIALAPHAQIHLPASGLGDFERGYAKFTPNRSNSFIAQTMFYFKNGDGRINSMYGIQAREALGTRNAGSFNLFLGMQNWLTVSNTTGSSVSINVGATTGSSTTSYVTSLDPYASVALPIHAANLFGTSPDTYGSLQITPSSPRSIVTDLIRLRSVNNDYDFAFPTRMAPQ